MWTNTTSPNWNASKGTIQTLKLSGSTLSITNGNSVNLPTVNPTSINVAGEGLTATAINPTTVEIQNTGIISLSAGTGITLGGTSKKPMVGLTANTIGVIAGDGLQGGGTPALGSSTTLSLPDTATAGTYNYPLSVKVDKKGRVETITTSATPFVVDISAGTGLTVSGTTTKTIGLAQTPITSLTAGTGIAITPGQNPTISLNTPILLYGTCSEQAIASTITIPYFDNIKNAAGLNPRSGPLYYTTDNKAFNIGVDGIYKIDMTFTGNHYNTQLTRFSGFMNIIGTANVGVNASTVIPAYVAPSTSYWGQITLSMTCFLNAGTSFAPFLSMSNGGGNLSVYVGNNIQPGNFTIMKIA